MKRIGIVGGTGYTGIELLRILATHQACDVHCLTSRSEGGKRVSELYPWLTKYKNLIYEDPSIDRLLDCDLVFYATPNKLAMKEASVLLESGTMVVDLAADFRFSDIGIWESTYGGTHESANIISDAVYGLPEKNRSSIQRASLVGNPGCYPTATLLGLLPLVEADALSCTSIIVDGKSGTSGAGRIAKTNLIVAEASDNFHAYSASKHRHAPEIQHQLERFGSKVSVTFVPHLLPTIRGIEVTIYVSTTLTAEEARQLYLIRYSAEPFVTVVNDASIHPETRWVRGSNRCIIGVYQQHPGELIISSVIDNLVKGAAGQAVQNMNLMLGFDETEALPLSALNP